MNSAKSMSLGVVILMFSLLPSIIVTVFPKASTTEASSVKAAEKG